MAYHAWQAGERVRTETRLLVDAFLNRGKLKFTDLRPPVTIGGGTNLGIGSSVIPFEDGSVPGSHLVCEVRVMTRVGEGVVGIQLVMTEGVRTHELPVRGAAVGESRSTRAHSFSVDAPVERLSRFDCEHEDGTIERMRIVTSGGRTSPWYGERLTGNPSLVALPDWRNHSLSATLSAAAAAAAAAAASDSLDDQKKAAAREAMAAAMAAPAWDVQKEYITGLVGVRTQKRLVGIGVVTRHVTKSHVFSYIWEAPEEDEGAARLSKDEDEDQAKASAGERASGSAEDTTGSPSVATVASSRNSPKSTFPSGSGGGSRNISSTQSRSGDESGSVISVPAPQSLAPSDQMHQLSPANRSEGNETGVDSGNRSGNGNGNGNSNQADPAPTLSPTLSRAEAKQQKFAKEMRDREQKKEENLRQTKQKEEEFERLIRGEKPPDENGDGSLRSGSTGAGALREEAKMGTSRTLPPHEEFASMLRMRRTDARRALERSIALARAARNYRGGSDNGVGGTHGALSALPVVMGLANWFHTALLPQLVPLPGPAQETAQLFHRGQRVLMTARATKARAERMRAAAESLVEQRQLRPRKGVMSPKQRAMEIEERQVRRLCVKTNSRWEC